MNPATRSNEDGCHGDEDGRRGNEMPVLKKYPSIIYHIPQLPATLSQIFDSPEVRFFPNVANTRKQIDKRQAISTVSADYLPTYHKRHHSHGQKSVRN